MSLIFSIVILFAWLSVVLGSPHLSPRIVGGTEVQTVVPFMVSLEIKGFQICGGSIVAPKFVLTAAHCVYYDTEPYSIRVNSLIRGFGGQVFNVSNSDIKRHPNYDTDTEAYDIAILKVPTLTNVQFVKTSNYPIRTEKFVYGWGQTMYEGAYSSRLRVVDVEVVDCGDSDYTFVDSSQFCAMGMNKDSCRGDSGGPLVVVEDGIYYLLGIVSWGQGCANARYPGVYTNVLLLLDWVNETMATM